MKVLIVGTGGREHAIAKALAKSKKSIEIYAVGGVVNPGIAKLGCVTILDINKPSVIVEYAMAVKIDVAIIGSENQLEQGLADEFSDAGIHCIGATRDQAIMVTSNIYMREHIPAKYKPRYHMFNSSNYSFYKLLRLLDDYDYNYVIKRTGIHVDNVDQADELCREILEQDGVVLIEECLFGEEFTVMAFVDHNTIVNMPVVRVFKHLGNDDTGPNTNGMGCVSFPGYGAPFLTIQDIRDAHKINSLIIKKLPEYSGILCGSFIKTDDGIKVVEYNSHFGDPAAINVLELLETDFVDIIEAICKNSLSSTPINWSGDSIVTSYIVPRGYPDEPHPTSITLPGSNNIIYAGVEEEDDVPWYNQTKSRSIAFCTRGATLRCAYVRNKALLRLVTNGNCHYRTDIGKQWL